MIGVWAGGLRQESEVLLVVDGEESSLQEGAAKLVEAVGGIEWFAGEVGGWGIGERGCEDEVEEFEGDFDADVCGFYVGEDEFEVGGGVDDAGVLGVGGVPCVETYFGVPGDWKKACHRLASSKGQVDIRCRGVRNDHDGSFRGAKIPRDDSVRFGSIIPLVQAPRRCRIEWGTTFLNSQFHVSKNSKGHVFYVLEDSDLAKSTAAIEAA